MGQARTVAGLEPGASPLAAPFYDAERVFHPSAAPVPPRDTRARARGSPGGPSPPSSVVVRPSVRPSVRSDPLAGTGSVHSASGLLRDEFAVLVPSASGQCTCRPYAPSVRPTVALQRVRTVRPTSVDVGVTRNSSGTTSLQSSFRRPPLVHPRTVRPALAAPRAPVPRDQFVAPLINAKEPRPSSPSARVWRTDSPPTTRVGVRFTVVLNLTDFPLAQVIFNFRSGENNDPVPRLSVHKIPSIRMVDDGR